MLSDAEKTAAIKQLESVVDDRKKELQLAIDEGADNLQELTKKMVLFGGGLILVYFILQRILGNKASKSRMAARLMPLITLGLQNGAKMMMTDIFSKVVDYLNTDNSNDQPNNKDTTEV